MKKEIVAIIGKVLVAASLLLACGCSGSSSAPASPPASGTVDGTAK